MVTSGSRILDGDKQNVELKASKRESTNQLVMSQWLVHYLYSVYGDYEGGATKCSNIILLFLQPVLQLGAEEHSVLLFFNVTEHIVL